MELGKTYDVGTRVLQLGTYEDVLYLNIPNGTDLIPEASGDQALVGSWTILEECSSCSMPLQVVSTLDYGDVLLCTKCTTPDVWVPLDFAIVQRLMLTATSMGEIPIRLALLEIQQENTL